MKIAYLSLDRSLNAPGDRRRFAGFANAAGQQFDIVDSIPRGYDIVVMTLGADISQWKKIQQRNGSVIFDTSDSYLSENAKSLTSILRGPFRTLTRTYKRPTISFGRLLLTAMSSATAITCASIEQASFIRHFHGSVHPIPDLLDELIAGKKLGEGPPQSPQTYTLLWEGLPENIVHFRHLMSVLNDVHKSLGISLIVVSHGSYFKYGQRYISKSTRDLFTEAHFPVEIREWTLPTLCKAAKASDLALIPISDANAMAWRKPENKLLSFWRLGVPTLTSATPSYHRLMADLGVRGACTDADSWGDLLTEFLVSAETRLAQATVGGVYASVVTSFDGVAPLWRRALDID